VIWRKKLKQDYPSIPIVGDPMSHYLKLENGIVTKFLAEPKVIGKHNYGDDSDRENRIFEAETVGITNADLRYARGNLISIYGNIPKVIYIYNLFAETFAQDEIYQYFLSLNDLYDDLLNFIEHPFVRVKNDIQVQDVPLGDYIFLKFRVKDFAKTLAVGDILEFGIEDEDGQVKAKLLGKNKTQVLCEIIAEGAKEYIILSYIEIRSVNGYILNHNRNRTNTKILRMKKVDYLKIGDYKLGENFLMKRNEYTVWEIHNSSCLLNNFIDSTSFDFTILKVILHL
jgi:hypothetical protein